MASTQRRLSSSVPVEIRMQFGNPKALQRTHHHALRQQLLENTVRLLLGGQHGHHEIGLRGHHLYSQFRSPSVRYRRPRAFSSSERCRNSLSESAAMPAACAGVEGSNGSFTLSRLRISSSCAKPYPMRAPGQAVDLRKRAQRDHVVVAVVHRIRIARVVLGVLEIGFVQNDQHALGHVPVELVELVLREDGAGGIVRVRQVDDLGVGVDLRRPAPAGRSASRGTARCGISRRGTAPAPGSR